MLLNLFLITSIIVILIDISGIINSIKYLIGKILNIKDYSKIKLKPFDCSFCMNFWLSLIYIYIMNQFTIVNILYICILSVLTPQIQDSIRLIQDIITKILNLIYEKFEI